MVFRALRMERLPPAVVEARSMNRLGQVDRIDWANDAHSQSFDKDMAVEMPSDGTPIEFRQAFQGAWRSQSGSF
jgi:hypothetical protein